MTESWDGERHSQASSIDIIQDENEKARREAENGLRQFDTVLQLVDSWVGGGRPFRLRPSLIQQLHREALCGINSFAGNWRPAGVKIGGSRHEPPGAHLVAELVEGLCDYVNENWSSKTAIQLSAYVMWRLNWIHPFSDGNGRTSRALSYFLLSVKLGGRISGTNTIPDQISRNKKPYYQALEAADRASVSGEIDLSAMEALLGDMLATQLLSLHNEATGISA